MTTSILVIATGVLICDARYFVVTKLAPPPAWSFEFAALIDPVPFPLTCGEQYTVEAYGGSAEAILADWWMDPIDLNGDGVRSWGDVAEFDRLPRDWDQDGTVGVLDRAAIVRGLAVETPCP